MPTAALALLLLLCACASDAYEARIGALQAQLDQMQKEQKEQAAWRRTIEEELLEGWASALCRPEVRQLLDDVRAECGATMEALRNPFDQPQKAPPQACATGAINPAVVDADPTHKGRFLSLMYGQRHEAVYVGRKGSIQPARVPRLGRLARPPLLRGTRFLVVAHPLSGANAEREAQERAGLVIGQLRALGVEATRILVWIYAFPIRKSEIVRFEDLPGRGEPTDLNASVWVFRVDC